MEFTPPWQQDYLSVHDFKSALNDGGGDWVLSQKFSSRGSCWTNRRSTSSNDKLTNVLERILCNPTLKDASLDLLLIQFWVPVKFWDRLYLKTADTLFAVGGDLFHSGLCKLRKHCMDYWYLVEGMQLGAVTRAYKTGLPESSPEICYYSSKEHPLRDEAIRYGFRGYAVVPIFHPLGGDCICVLELFSERITGHRYITVIEEALQKEGLSPANNIFPRLSADDYEHVGVEIGELLKWAIDAVPELHLVQVSHPSCYNSHKQNLVCLQSVDFAILNEVRGERCNYDEMMEEFTYISRTHNTQIKSQGTAGFLLSSPNSPCLICRNLSDLSIAAYSLSHYARHARLSFYFAICLLNTKIGGKPFIFEFFLHLNSREDEYPYTILKLLLNFMDIELKGFKSASGRSLGESLLVELRTEDKALIPLELGTSSIPLPIPKIARHVQEAEFNVTWRMVGSTNQVTTFVVENFLKETKWAMAIPVKTSLVFSPAENKRYSSAEASLLSPIHNIPEKIKVLLNAVSNLACLSDCLVQFWAPKKIENKLFLATSDQTFALGYPSMELFEIRKWCVDHLYLLDDGATEKELGPPGRAFRNCCPEYTPDLRLYSSKEFPLRDCAAHLGLRMYLALPVLYSNDESDQVQCAGILEVMGRKLFTIPSLIDSFEFVMGMNISFEEANLKLPHFNGSGVLVGNVLQALCEVDEMLKLVLDIHELILADIWVPCKQCDDDKCMFLVRSKSRSNHDLRSTLIIGLRLNNSREKKEKGITGILLTSESKSCFCANLSDFSITEEPSVHYTQQQRLTVCFAICLQSSLTGSMPYVAQFFLDQACKTCENLCLFLSSLLPIMKEKLKSFRVASGRLLEEELVIEVITFTTSEFSSFGDNDLDELPVRFKIVHCGQQSDVQQTADQATRDAYDDVHSGTDVLKGTQNDTARMDLNSSNNVAENEQNDTTSVELNSSRDVIEDDQNDTTCLDLGKKEAIESKKRERKIDKKHFNITRELLQLHFGKPLAEVAKELGVSKSTIKRAKERLGIHRWPSHPKNKKNPSVFKTVLGDHVETSKKQPSRQDPNIVECDQNVVELEMDDVVIIKACFGEDMVKFPFDVSSKLDKLNQEVASRLNIKVGSFKLKYLDEDSDWIMLTRDDELQFCTKNLKELDKTTVKIMVQLLCN